MHTNFMKGKMDQGSYRFGHDAFDWHKKVITYTQQKSGKANTLPLLPPIGEAIIDYLKNGRLDSDYDNVFIRHVHPYGAIASSSTLSESIKRYMRQAGLTVKNRKAAHSMRHTVASTLLKDGVPLMTISNILGHDTPKTTMENWTESLKSCMNPTPWDAFQRTGLKRFWLIMNRNRRPLESV